MHDDFACVRLIVENRLDFIDYVQKQYERTDDVFKQQYLDLKKNNTHKNRYVLVPARWHMLISSLPLPINARHVVHI